MIIVCLYINVVRQVPFVIKHRARVNTNSSGFNSMAQRSSVADPGISKRGGGGGGGGRPGRGVFVGGGGGVGVACAGGGGGAGAGGGGGGALPAR